MKGSGTLVPAATLAFRLLLKHRSSRRTIRASYVIFRAQSKMKTLGPLCENITTFQTVTAENYTHPQTLCDRLKPALMAASELLQTSLFQPQHALCEMEDVSVARPRGRADVGIRITKHPQWSLAGTTGPTLKGSSLICIFLEQCQASGCKNAL